MKKILHVVGARPQFIKAFITIKSLNKLKFCKNILLNTGQHYDYSMSKVFFKELKFSNSLIEINLKEKTDRLIKLSEMISKLSRKIKKIKPHLVIVYGDTDTTLAASIVVRRLQIALMHIESGLRSDVIDMPEEQNRYISDYLSNYLVAPTKFAKQNLKYLSKKRDVYNFGDVMYDSILFYKKHIDKKYIEKFNKKNNINQKYIFLSIHRDSNSNLNLIKKYLKQISEVKKIFFWPVHPKIQKIIKNHKLKMPNNLIYVKPIPYLDTITAILGSEFVVTDSGGVQKESYFLNKKCFVLREETEWKELISLNSLKLIGNNLLKIQENRKFLNNKIKKSNLYGEGTATKKITQLIKKLLKKNEKKNIVK
jgi:UDP-GlcNAc3NAcA epimerase